VFLVQTDQRYLAAITGFTPMAAPAIAEEAVGLAIGILAKAFDL
jgi:hypothetical protein